MSLPSGEKHTDIIRPDNSIGAPTGLPVAVSYTWANESWPRCVRGRKYRPSGLTISDEHSVVNDAGWRRISKSAGAVQTRTMPLGDEVAKERPSGK